MHPEFSAILLYVYMKFLEILVYVVCLIIYFREQCCETCRRAVRQEMQQREYEEIRRPVLDESDLEWC